MSQKQNQTRNSKGTVWLCEGKRYKNAIYILHTKIEQAVEVKKRYICASLTSLTTPRNDLTEYDDEIITLLTQLKIDGNNLQMMKMFWEQTVAMRVNGEISSFKKIKHGVREGCMLSRDPFSLFSEIIMRNIEGSQKWK